MPKRDTTGAQMGFNMSEPVRCDASEPLPSLEDYPAFGFDTETTSEPLLWDRSLAGISLFLPSLTTGAITKRYLPLRHPGGGNYDEDSVRRWMKNECRNKTLVVANGKHEHHTLKKWGIDFEEQSCSFRDVFHQAALLNERRYKLNMSILVMEEFNEKLIDVNHKLLHTMPAAQAAPVAIQDAEYAWKLYDVYGPRIEEEELWKVLDLEDDLIFSTCEMERNGSYLNIPLLLQYLEEVKAEFEARVSRIVRTTNRAINPTSGDDMSTLLRYLGITNPYRTEPTESSPDGNESFDEEALLNIIYDNPHEPLLRVALEARQLASFRSKYLDAYLNSVQPDGRIYYSLHQMRSDEGGTITGRYSSSKMFKAKNGGINIQQVAKTKKMPKLLQRWPIRCLFIPPPGKVYVSSDASQIEFRVFAHYASTLLGQDRVAAKYREEPLFDEKGKCRVDFHGVVQEWTGQIRDITKNINFRKLYGGGPAKGQLMINQQNKLDGKPLISLRDAEEMDDKYDKEFPEAKDLLKMAERQAKGVGFIRTLLGRRTRFDTGNPDERFYKALNMALQGGATGDLVKMKIRHMYKERKTLEVTMRSQVHDEVNGDLEHESQKKRFADFMNEQEFELRCPILWETGVGPNWEQAK